MNKDRKKVFEVGSVLVKRYSEKMCLAEKLNRIKCKGSIIDSHTVPKSNSLKKIAKDGHVYAYMHLDFMHIDNHKGELKPKLIGVGKASTFKGFCGEHDRELFSSVETKDFEATPEQCFALFYRAYAKEVYNKKVQHNDRKSNYDLVDKMEQPEFIKQQAYNLLDKYFEGIALAIDDVESLKPIMDDILEKENYEKSKALVLEFEAPLPFMVSGSVYPEQDFNGNSLQQLGSKNFDPLTSLGCTSFASNDKGYFVFSWLDLDNKLVEEFINSFLEIKENYKFNHLLKMTFNFFENIYMSPEWWDSLGKEHQDYLNNLINRGMNPKIFVPKFPLKYDGYRLPSIKIDKITKVNF
ncbi:hypothetical protein NQ646_02390 [Acinetobacter baumannii]|uniref:hypothetical protein n=1 Tax=Acinetobacter baumannii TaxID=470 RepID=UPI00234082CE|nr:hypothetical protein [Acinetobacter baumannii]